MSGVQIPATVFFDMLMRQRIEENFKDALKEMIDAGYDPSDVYDQLDDALFKIAGEYGMENPQLHVGDIEFFGGEGDPKFPFEKGQQ